jgi:ferric-dicitrate binding protein FerR (iron transport regulator)
MNAPDFRRLTVEELVLDERFRNWVLAPTPELDAHWTAYQQAHADQRETLGQAAELVQHLRVRFDDLGLTSQQRIWQELQTRFDALDTPVLPLGQPTRAWWRPTWGRVAAAVAVLVVTGVAGYRYLRTTGPAQVHTVYGETRSVTLPDGSTVLLNGNSTLTYAAEWSEQTPREVWLEGEGFFKITKKNSPRGRVKFVTHAGKLDITVLGTQFNVNTRHGTTAVTLLEGKVQLQNPHNRQTRVLEMKPGDHALLPSGIENVEIRHEKLERYAAWTHQLFVFENTPLREVAAQLRDTYGLEVVFEDSELANRRLTANLSNQNLETLLTVIAATFDLDLERTDNQVTLRRKP